MLIIITNIVKYTLLYTVDTVKYSMNTEDILEELTKVDDVSPITLEFNLYLFMTILAIIYTVSIITMIYSYITAPEINNKE